MSEKKEVNVLLNPEGSASRKQSDGLISTKQEQNAKDFEAILNGTAKNNN